MVSPILWMRNQGPGRSLPLLWVTQGALGGAAVFEFRDRPAAPRGFPSKPVCGCGHMASLSSAGVPLHQRWPTPRTAAPAALRNGPGPAQGARRARRRPEQGRGARRDPGASARVGGGGGLGRRGIEWRARRAACPVPARPSKPPFFSLALGGGPQEIREGAQLAVPAGRSRRTLPPTPPPPRETHKERPGGERTPPVWAGLREGPARSAAPSLKGPPAPRAHCAGPTVGRGGT